MSLESPSQCEARDTPLIDTVIGGYVTWRESSAAVAAKYQTWAQARGDRRSTAFADYVAALDREERAASGYERLVKQPAASW
jgi:hypothetical protein